MLDQQKRITFLITSLDYRGAETQLVNLAIQLRTLGWTVQVVSMIPPLAFTEELAAADIPVASLGMRKGVPDPRAIWRLAKLLRQWQPQVLHSYAVHANILARVMRLFMRVPVLISSVRNIYEGGRWREIAIGLTDPLCDLTTHVCKAGVERYVQVGAVPANKILFMPNSVDPERFLPNRESRERIRRELNLEEKFVWLAVGCIEEQKDYPNMLRAFAQVSRQFPETLLLICGKGSLQDRVGILAEELERPNQVRFLGLRRDIPEMMNAVDAYLMSSAWEGTPSVLLEASAVGLPIVATDVGGNREVVLDGKSGFLVPSKNSEALAGAMQRLMELPEFERRRMGMVGRGHVVANYSLERCVARWEELYRDQLSKLIAA